MKTVGQKTRELRSRRRQAWIQSTRRNGVSAFETINEKSFAGKWKVIYFRPKDFTFVCPTEIVGFNKLARQLEERDAVLLGGSRWPRRSSAGATSA